MLAVADRAIGPVAEELARVLEGVPPSARPRYALHLSGALGLEALAPLARLGLATEVFHPLLPLPGGPAAGRDRLAGGYATVVYAPGQNRAPVGPVLARALGATPILWPGATARQLALYHAAATLAANGVTALLWAAEAMLRLSGFPGPSPVPPPGQVPVRPAGSQAPAPAPAPAPDPAPAAAAGGAPVSPSGPAPARPGPGQPPFTPAPGRAPGLTPVLPGGSPAPAPAPGPAPADPQAAPSPGPGRGPLLSLAAAALAAVAERGPLEALTGPIARGDVATVRRHLEALEAFEAVEATGAGDRPDPAPAPAAGRASPTADRAPYGDWLEATAEPAPGLAERVVAPPGAGGFTGADRPAVPAPRPAVLDPGPAGRYRLAAALILAAAAARPETPRAALAEMAGLLGLGPALSLGPGPASRHGTLPPAPRTATAPPAAPRPGMLTPANGPGAPPPARHAGSSEPGGPPRPARGAGSSALAGSPGAPAPHVPGPSQRGEDGT